MEENDSGYKGWQKALIALILLLLLGSLALYFSGVSLRSLLGISGGAAGEKVGEVVRVQGELKRQPFDSLEFVKAAEKADLFNEDTLMTGPEDTAVISLIDGSQLELEPGSLIRLSFESSFSLGGIQRRVLVDVVSGNVKGQPKSGQIVHRSRPAASPAPTLEPPPVEPTPEPTMEEPSPVPSPEVSPPPAAAMGEGVRFVSPKNRSTLALSEGGQPPLRTQFRISSQTEPDLSGRLVVRTKQGKSIYSQPVEFRNGSAVVNMAFDRPGSFTAEIVDAEGKAFEKSNRVNFSVGSQFLGVKTLPPLVGGQEHTSNELRGKRLKDFKITFRWEPYGKIENYRLTVKGADGATLLDQDVAGTEHTLEPGRVSIEQFTYEVTASLPNGFTATSGPRPFLFNFLSPKQTLPKDGTSLSYAATGKGKKGGVLFTWQKTSFTQSYDFELAADPQFAKILKTVNLKENFVVFKNLNPGQYYWRIRANGDGIKSPPNAPYRLTITP